MGPQDEVVDKSILFATEIKGIDPNFPTEGTRSWKGEYVKALSFDQAAEYCMHYRGYLKVTGPAGSDPGQTDTVLDATDFITPVKTKSPAAQNFNQYIAQDPTQYDETAEPQDCCQAGEVLVEEVEGFAEGDVVMLKSTGPLMTIRTKTRGFSDCTYFVGTDLYEQGFSDDCLVYVSR